MTKTLMVFDVESIGLYGEGFAVGLVVIDRESKTVTDQAYLACPTDAAQGTPEDREWVEKNIVPYLPPPKLAITRQVREEFWRLYRRIGGGYKDCSIWADCGYPVEDGFMRTCIHDNLSARKWNGPYPLQEIATVRTALGLDPTLAYQLPEDKRHNPLEECLYIAPKLVEWLDALDDMRSLYVGVRK